MTSQQQQESKQGSPEATGMAALSKGRQQEKPQPQQQKRQQQQDLCGKAIITVAGNEARNMAVNVAVVAVKCPQVAVVFARSGSEGLQGSGWQHWTNSLWPWT